MSLFLASACGLNNLSKQSNDNPSESGTTPQAYPANPQDFEFHFLNHVTNEPVQIQEFHVVSIPNNSGIEYMEDGILIHFNDFAIHPSSSYRNTEVSLVFKGFETCPINFVAWMGGSIVSEDTTLPTLFGNVTYFDQKVQGFTSQEVVEIANPAQHSDQLNGQFTACGTTFEVDAVNTTAGSVSGAANHTADPISGAHQ
jgi:hypothetical protein